MALPSGLAWVETILPSPPAFTTASVTKTRKTTPVLLMVRMLATSFPGCLPILPSTRRSSVFTAWKCSLVRKLSKTICSAASVPPVLIYFRRILIISTSVTFRAVRSAALTPSFTYSLKTPTGTLLPAGQILHHWYCAPRWFFPFRAGYSLRYIPGGFGRLARKQRALHGECFFHRRFENSGRLWPHG